MVVLDYNRGSSNGRTPGFEPVNGGSIPPPRVKFRGEKLYAKVSGDEDFFGFGQPRTG